MIPALILLLCLALLGLALRGKVTKPTAGRRK